MYDIDRPKFIFVSLLEDFIREAEHSLAYFFALLVFLLTFLLTLFGREAFYTGLIGVFCLLLIKLRDIIEGIKDVRSETLAENGESALSSSEGTITIGINVTLTEGDDEGNKAILDTFAQEAGYKDFNTMNDRLTAGKGWTVTWQSQNSVAIVTPLSMDEPLPIFAKLYECPEEVAEFTDGEKYYTIDYGFAVNGPKAAEYAKFGTLAEALETWNLVPYIKEETNV
jgi:hypothetical protein